MNEMIKAERNKICSRKQTRMLFLAGVVLIVAYFFFFQFNYQNLIEEKHYPFSTTDKYFAEQSGMTSYPLFVCGQMVLLESPELAAALSALSQMEQEIIFLYYFQRLTHREIGRRYGRAGNTTGRRIQMILRRLRAELEGLSYEPATSL